jgi:hypothetical protein
MRGLITQLLTATTPGDARRPGVVPGEPGVYAWWLSSVPDELPEVPLQPRHDNGLSLLYVGIAPRRPSSRQTLRTRIVGNHLRGNVGASTFRLSLTALLWEREGWRPHWRSTRVQLPPEDNAALTRWQEQHLRVHGQRTHSHGSSSPKSSPRCTRRSTSPTTPRTTSPRRWRKRVLACETRPVRRLDHEGIQRAPLWPAPRRGSRGRSA